MSKPVIVTGAAGFIGFHVAQTLMQQHVPILGIDNFNAYYDPSLKEARWSLLQKNPLFTAERADLSDSLAVNALFEVNRPDYIIHLAGQPGVRQSIETPDLYIPSNITSFLNILEGCRHYPVQHLIYASSSSVYGLNTSVPFNESDPVQKPSSLYAATKIADEAMAHAYSHLYQIPSSGLRFFTVYGPWGRPDMAVYTFTDAIANNRPITVANAGRIWRDFTYIDDIVEGILRLLHKPPFQTELSSDEPDHGNEACRPPLLQTAPHRIYNIGNDHPEELNELIRLIEEELGQKAVRKESGLPPGDIVETWADVRLLRETVGFSPDTKLKEGVRRFVAWYRDFHMNRGQK